MEQIVTKEVVLTVVGVMAILSFCVTLANGLKKLFTRRPDQECITRSEYDKDERGRAEHFVRVEARCTGVENKLNQHAAEQVAETKTLIESMAQLRIELASLTAHLRSSCPGGNACRTPLPPPPQAGSRPPLPGSSAQNSTSR